MPRSGHLDGWSAAVCVAGTLSLACGCDSGPSRTGNAALLLPPSAQLEIHPSVVATGDAATLTWSSTNAASCAASGGWVGNLTPSGSQPTGPLGVTTDFTLRCSGAVGTALRSATATVVGTAAFPLTHSADNRYLQDQRAIPFPILGRASWYVISISPSEYQSYLDDTLAKGFNSIEMQSITHDRRANNAPFAGNGAAPFTTRLDGKAWNGSLKYANIADEAPDFTTTNEAYWSYLDGLIDYCATRGILIFMFPSYVGYQGLSDAQGYMDEMVANGPGKMQSYGAWVARRYKDKTNIVWMLGGDAGTGPQGFNAAQTAVETAFVYGLTSILGQRTPDYSAEWSSESIATDQTILGGYITLNGSYSFTGKTAAFGRRAYVHSPTLPAFLLEEPYDEEGPTGTHDNPAATQPVRRYIWWGMLSAVGGYIAGNGYVWRFNPGYTQHLNSQGAIDLAHLNTFIKNIAWWQLVPSGLNGMKTLVSAAGGVNSDNYVAAAAASSGGLLVAYIPPAHSPFITIDMTAMRGMTRASWFDPATGVLTSIGTTFPNDRWQAFAVPRKNEGFSDWVLLLQSP